ncbi:MAG: hypothetical protein ACTHWA_04695 [Arachnia sp.]
MDARTLCLIPPARPAGLSDPLLDAYLEFMTARSRPPDGGPHE